MSKELKKKEEAEVAEKVTPQALEEFLLGTEVAQKLSEPQKKLFIATAMAQHLNPFKREIHAVPYKTKSGKYELSIVTGYEVYLRRAERSGKLAGWKVWTEGSKAQGTLKACIEIYRKDWQQPFRHEVLFKEYNKNMSLWLSKPITQLKKVAISQGFRLAFPEEVGGLPYSAEEIDVGGEVLPKEVKIDVEAKKAEIEEEKQEVEEVFGEEPELTPEEIEAESKRLIKKIHTLLSVKKVDDVAYRTFLMENFGKKSSTEISNDEKEITVMWLQEFPEPEEEKKEEEVKPAPEVFENEKVKVELISQVVDGQEFKNLLFYKLPGIGSVWVKDEAKTIDDLVKEHKKIALPFLTMVVKPALPEKFQKVMDDIEQALEK